jgi:hypothetical protein
MSFGSQISDRGSRMQGVLFFTRRCRRHPNGPGTQRERVRVVIKRHRRKFENTFGTREIPRCSATSMPKSPAMSQILTHWTVLK